MSIILKLTAAKDRPPLRGFDHYWNVIMDCAMAEKPFSARDIFNCSNAHMSDINDFLRRLVKAKIIEMTGNTGERNEAFYRVLVRQSATPKVRRDGTIVDGMTKQQAIWNYMRSEAGRLGFTAQDITVWQRAGDTPIDIDAVKSYVKFLHKAGYLLEVQKGRPGKLGVYRLQHHMNTGPKPPMILRIKAVFDQNRHEIVGPAEAQEVQP
ncbi:hypothetical protein [Brucella inopinata]|uniref:Uncharacterized protein n=1 Tax=Brucella inopinata TaxID=1218315 RepID=A0AAW7BA42_9HYPH|nr:hypothetical protein [Brucella inopinata]MDL2332869.1 hypothetical protein [Brucella inopinata]